MVHRPAPVPARLDARGFVGARSLRRVHPGGRLSRSSWGSPWGCSRGPALAAAPSAKAAAKSQAGGPARGAELVKEATACQILHPQRCPALAEVVELGRGRRSRSCSRCFEDESVPLRAAAAAQRLGIIGREGAGLGAARAAVKDPHENVRVAAIGAMGRVNPEGAVEALARALGAESVNEKLMATVALGQTGSPGAVMPLISSLTHFHPKVRSAAARALGAMRDRRATLPIGTILADPTNRWPVRVAACEALARMGDPDGVAMLLMATSDPELQAKTWRRFGRSGSSATRSRCRWCRCWCGEPGHRDGQHRGARAHRAHADALPALLRVITERKLRAGDAAGGVQRRGRAAVERRRRRR
jgi:hypothetical protein